MADPIFQAYVKLQQQKQEALMEGAEVLEEGRIDWLKANMKDVSFAHDPHGPAKTPHDLIDHIAQHGDPTKNKVHTQWLTHIYSKGALKQEDMYKAHETLTDFEGTPSSKGPNGEKIEGKRGVKHAMSPEEKQITPQRYPTLQSLQAAMAKHTGGLPASKISERMNEWHGSGKGGHEQVYDDEHIRVYRIHNSPEGKEASKAIYGGGAKDGGTEWCTANRNEDHNYFDHYMGEHPGSHLYVVHRKTDGEVFQYHTHSDQFMDRNDESINHEDIKSIQPSLHKMWEKDPSTLD